MIQLLSSLPLPSTFLFNQLIYHLLIYVHNLPIHAANLLPIKRQYSACHARIQTLAARAAGGSSPEPQDVYNGTDTPTLQTQSPF